MKKLIRLHWTEWLIFTIFFIFSWVLMWKTFKVASPGNILFASRVWSDFAATFPIIRSFSYGNNFPPQYPLFAGPPMRYHFAFYLIVGLMERFGIPIDWSLNSLSIVTFFTLLLVIYFIGKHLFKSKWIGIIAVVLFLFNGSWGFLEYFKTHSINNEIFYNIIHNKSFSSFGPYDGKIVSAFWSLNIFTNQRHLALAYTVYLTLFLFLFYWNKRPDLFSSKKIILIGIIVGFFPFIHMAVFGMLGILLILSVLLFPNLRKKIIIAGLIALLISIPQIIYMGKSQIQTSLIHIGYLNNDSSILGFFRYWFLNLGLTLILAPIGFILAARDQKKFIIPFAVLFIIGNTIQFSPEIAANHKFFNLFVICLNFYTAYLLVNIVKKYSFAGIIAGLIFPFLILTGLIDFFPIMNDNYISLQDIPDNKSALFIYNNTPKNAVFLNSSYLYNPANIAGRKIYMGWPYFAWSAGYDTDQRGKTMTKFYTSFNKSEQCNILKQEKLDYFTIENTFNNPDLPDINLDYFFATYRPIYTQSNPSFAIFSTRDNCT